MAGAARRLHFGQLLRAARLFVPYSLDEMARAVSVGKAKLVAWEAGDRTPTDDELGAIAVALRSSAARMVDAAALFRLGYDIAAVAHAAAAHPAPFAPRRSLEGPANQPPRSLPPVRDPRSGRFVSALRTARSLVSAP